MGEGIVVPHLNVLSGDTQHGAQLVAQALTKDIDTFLLGSCRELLEHRHGAASTGSTALGLASVIDQE
jgi:hypothetical protein